MALPQRKSSPIISEPKRKLRIHPRTKPVINYKFRELKRLEKLEKTEKGKFLKSIIGSVSLSVLFIGLCFYSFLTVNSQNKELKNLQSMESNLKAKNDSIILELTPYTNSKTIEEIAKTSLGLDYPTADQFLYLERE